MEKYLPAAQGVGGARGEPRAVRSAPSMTAPDSSHLRLLLQRTIREGYESETQDGRPASSLMGKRLGFDQGRMYLSFSPFTQLVATNDFAVLFLFTPRSTLAHRRGSVLAGRRQGDGGRCREDDLGMG